MTADPSWLIRLMSIYISKPCVFTFFHINLNMLKYQNVIFRTKKCYWSSNMYLYIFHSRNVCRKQIYW